MINVDKIKSTVAIREVHFFNANVKHLAKEFRSIARTLHVTGCLTVEPGANGKTGAQNMADMIDKFVNEPARHGRHMVPLSDLLVIYHLPLQVVEEILDARQEAMQEFFDSWSESIRKNAARDKEAAKTREEKAAIQEKYEGKQKLISQSVAHADAALRAVHEQLQSAS